MILRPYQEGDEVAILSLFSQCFCRDMQKHYWRWRFLNNPICQSFLYLAWDGKVLAAHYAVSPVFVVIEEKDYLTSLSMTTMTHPKYRGLKLFPQLAKQVYDRMTDLNYLMVWGFPNGKSHKSFIRDLQWVDVYEIPTMNLKVDHNLRICTNDIAMDDHFDFDYIDNIFSTRLIHVKKNREYLQWRYKNNPINKYTNLVIAREKKVSSFCVVKKYLKSLDIVDFQARDEDEGEKLLNQAVSFAYLNNLEYINCWAPLHHFLHSLCERLGFINKEPITYLGFRQLSENKITRVSNNYSAWYIQMGDSDVY